MRKDLISAFSVAALLAAFVVYSFWPVDTALAQRDSSQRYEYAVINGSYLPYPAEGPSGVTGAVNVCYVAAAGCQNEEVRIELNVSKFLQDERLENTVRTKRLVQDRAMQNAFARAIAKLGSEGWEMMTAPQIEFDFSYTNPQGIQTVKEGLRTERQHVWFKRQR